MLVSPLQSADSVQLRIHTRHKVTGMLWIHQSVRSNAGTRRKGVGVYTQGRTKKAIWAERKVDKTEDMQKECEDECRTRKGKPSLK